MTLRVAASGIVRAGTGIGVVQRRLYPLLESRGIELALTESRDAGDGLAARLRGLVRGWRSPDADYAAFLSAVPPTPFGLRRPLVTIVHDLRWQRTRAGASRAYRAWDLRRAVKHSAVLICISDRARADLEAFDSRAVGRTVVAWEGPGILPSDSFTGGEPGRVLLVGGAAHKRNELAAEVLATRPAWCREVVGVGVSQAVRERLDAAYPGATTWLGRVSDEELVAEYRRAERFVFFGVEEGFGLPYIEALAAGCIVIAIDQPLTRELLEDAAMLLPDGSAEELIAALGGSTVPEESTRRTIADRYSWDGFAEGIAAALRRAAQASGPTTP